MMRPVTDCVYNEVRLYSQFHSVKLQNTDRLFSIILVAIFSDISCFAHRSVSSTMYTVNHKKHDILFLTITLVSLDRIL